MLWKTETDGSEHTVREMRTPQDGGREHGVGVGLGEGHRHGVEVGVEVAVEQDNVHELRQGQELAEGSEHPESVLPADDTLQVVELEVDGVRVRAGWAMVNGRHLLRLGHRLHVIDGVEIDGGLVRFTLDGASCSVRTQDERDLLLERLGFESAGKAREGVLAAPMPGRVLNVLARPGDAVQVDEPLIILEAMKMENELKSPIAGTLSAVHVQEGDSVEKKQTLLEITP